MRAGHRPRGLRARIVVWFAVGSLLVSLVLVAMTFLLARNYLLDQRESSLTRQAYTDADVLRTRLATSGAQVGDVLADLVPSGGADVVVRRGDAWYSSSLDVGARDVPPALREVLASGNAGTLRVDLDGPRQVVGIPVPGAGIEFYEVSSLAELQTSLRTLAAVLGGAAVVATAAGALFGASVSRRAVQPLEQVAAAATRIAGGELSARLPDTDDPDLVAIVGSFNSMVDALASRIDRDARFVGDVSHELRSPLTSLVTSVEVLAARRHELSDRGRQALALVEGQLERFDRMLGDLLQLAAIDSAPGTGAREPVSVTALVREVLAGSSRPAGLLHARPDGDTVVPGDKRQLERAVLNLLDNADRHGGGVTSVLVEQDGPTVVLRVEDAGPGVPQAERERVFERFSRGASAARGSLPGAGLGLAGVAEVAARHGGAAWVDGGSGTGARVTLSLPRAQA